MRNQQSKPIIFSAPMIRVILSGQKTQTRRLVKGSINSRLESENKLTADYPLSSCSSLDNRIATFRIQNSVDSYTTESIPCPYGISGDVLWVRETWAKDVPGCESQGGYAYRADHSTGNDGPLDIKWKPSIHMPRAASRISLRITDIGVERLQQISEDDVISEGLVRLSKDGGTTYKFGITDVDGLPGGVGWEWQQWQQSPQKAFQHLWNSIHTDLDWDANPWVWVISFEIYSLKNHEHNQD